MEYKVVMCGSITAFESEVNRLLHDGWELHGNLTTQNTWFIQAMVLQTARPWVSK